MIAKKGHEAELESIKAELDKLNEKMSKELRETSLEIIQRYKERHEQLVLDLNKLGTYANEDDTEVEMQPPTVILE